jgi:uncharacterized membrane protein
MPSFHVDRVLPGRLPAGRALDGVVLLAFLALAAALADYMRVLFYGHQLDSALLADIVDNIARSGQPMTWVGRASLDGVAAWGQYPEVLCQQPMQASPAPLNMFTWHAYGILYLVAPLALLVPTVTLVAALNAVSFMAVPAVSYLFLRREQVPGLVALLAALMITAHPAWSSGAVGQFYVDRYFMPLGLIFALALHDHLRSGRDRTLAVAVAGTLAALCTERSAIMVGCYALGCLVLYIGRYRWSRTATVALIVGVASLGYAAAYMAFGMANTDYVGFRRPLANVVQALLSDPVERSRSGAFLLVNLAIFAPLAVLNWRAALLAAGAMLPNVIGSIGGAEKTGWQTHYHALYFPFLICAVLLGIARLSALVRRRWGALAAPLLVSTVLLTTYVPAANGAVSFSATQWRSHALVQAAQSVLRTGPPEAHRQRLRTIRSALARVSPGAAVTTIEPLFPTLYRGRRLSYYPIGIGSVDVAVLPYTPRPDGTIAFEGAINYHGPAATARVNACARERLAAAGYVETERLPLWADGSGFVILSRAKSAATARP